VLLAVNIKTLNLLPVRVLFRQPNCNNDGMYMHANNKIISRVLCLFSPILVSILRTTTIIHRMFWNELVNSVQQFLIT